MFNCDKCKRLSNTVFESVEDKDKIICRKCYEEEQEQNGYTKN